MNRKNGIVIPLDGSETAATATGAAQAMALALDAVLHIVHVTDDLPLPEEELTGQLCAGDSKLRDYVLHQLPGDVVDTIVDFSNRQNIRMIVMSSHGKTFDEVALMGHVSMEIIQRAPIPVMVIRPDMKKLPDAGWRPRKILVPLNGSPEAAAAMDQALQLADALGCSIDVVHIAMLGEQPPQEAGSMTSPRYLDYAYYEWSAWAGEFMARFAKQQPSAKLHLYHRQGSPAEETLKLAAESSDDLLLLPWHGLLQKDHARTLRELLRRTEVPVILIKTV
ncbi:MAG: universal stress protein [Thermoleophilia bacterium]|nr:universal stress protein [Thermoleophilia bacterium]